MAVMRMMANVAIDGSNNDDDDNDVGSQYDDDENGTW